MFRLLNLLALLGAVAWSGAKWPDWEPAVTSLALLATLIGQEVSRSRKDRSQARDRALFLRFKDEFPSTGKTTRFLKEFDIGNSFPADSLDDLDRFLTQWSNAECQFLDSRMESERKVLLVVGKEFNLRLSNSISPDARGRYSIKLHDMELRPDMLKLQGELNDLATRVYRAHQNLMRAGARLE